MNKLNIKHRESNIELLRIICMIGVIFLHINYNIALSHTESLNRIVMLFMECLNIGSVNIFLIISGYFLCRTNKRKLIKPLMLIIQVMIFSFGIYIINSFVTGNQIQVKQLLLSILPLNYFVVLYCVVYLISPLFNFVIQELNNKQFSIVLLILIGIFSCGNILVDIGQLLANTGLGELSTISSQGDQQGYNIVNFSLMYLIGSYIYKNRNNIKITTFKNLLLVVLCTVIIFIMQYSLMKFISIRTNTPEINTMGNCALAYDNPLVILLSALIFILFLPFKINCKVINELSKGAFTTYLLHVSLLPIFPIISICDQNAFIMLGSLIIIAVILYLISGFVFKIYNFLINPLIRLLAKIFPLLNNNIYRKVLQ